MPIHPRHPYVGDLVFTAFSGSHQDAIKKGFEVQKADSLWEVPYLPIDPSDVGRTYDSVIRVNSQSGKGGIAYLLESRYGLAMPRRLQVEFSSAIQKITDANGSEVTAENLWEAFQQEYIRVNAPIEYVKHRIDDQGERETITLTVKIGGDTRVLTGNGNGPLDALMDALQVPVRIQHYEERATGQGADATAVAFAEMTCDGVPGSVFGVGINPNLTTASIRSAISGINRTYARADESVRATFFAAQANATTQAAATA